MYSEESLSTTTLCAAVVTLFNGNHRPLLSTRGSVLGLVSSSLLCGFRPGIHLSLSQLIGRLCQLAFRAKILANIRLVETYNGCWVQLSAVLRRSRCCSKSERDIAHGHNYYSLVPTRRKQPPINNQPLDHTGTHCGVFSVIRPSPLLSTWFPYKKDISAEGFTHTLYYIDRR